MAFKARYRAHPKFEEKVVDATADVPGARDACMSIANAVVASARANVEALTLTGRGADDAQTRVANLIGVKPVKVFVRKARYSGSRIPVALVVSDHPMSKWFEYGHGRSFPITRFMRNAAASASGRGVRFGAARGTR